MSDQAEIKAIEDDLKVVRDPWVRRTLKARLRELEEKDRRGSCGVPCSSYPFCPCGGGG